MAEMSMEEITFSKLCSGEEGCVLDISKYCRVEENNTITEAWKIVAEQIETNIKEIERVRVNPLESFFIGKTYIDGDEDDIKSDDHRKWGKAGIGAAYGRQEEENRKSMMVVAVVTEKCIPDECKEKGYIIDAEEYANTLKTRLIQWFDGRDERMKNDPAGPSGKKKRDANGYIIYVACGK